MPSFIAVTARMKARGRKAISPVAAPKTGKTVENK
jgi:hypothetical protein